MIRRLVHGKYPPPQLLSHTRDQKYRCSFSHFEKSALNGPQMCFKVKRIHVHAAYTPEAQTCVPFILRLSIFNYARILRKLHQNGIKMTKCGMFKVRSTCVHSKYTPENQLFARFSLRWGIFDLWPSMGEIAQHDPQNYIDVLESTHVVNSKEFQWPKYPCGQKDLCPSYLIHPPT